LEVLEIALFVAAAAFDQDVQSGIPDSWFD
jgi:hypothetical protein